MVIKAMRKPSQSFSFASRRQGAYNRPYMTTTWIIFTILSNIPASRISGIFRQLGAPLQPRFPFWLGLCRQAALINPQNHPSSFFYRWLGWSPEDQTRHLLEAWQNSPRTKKNRAWRARILRRLQSGQSLRPADQIILPGLHALGICQDQHLSQWGATVFGLHPAPTPVSGATWRIERDRLIIQLPTRWPLLWQLEAFLDPLAPLTYSLDEKSLRRAGQQGDPQELIAILEQGTGGALAQDLRARILGQPSLRQSTLTLLEFSSPAELRQLRRSPALRPYFERVLSPRHVAIDPSKAASLLKMLERRGVYTPLTRRDGDEEEGRGGVRTHFTRADLLQPLGPAIPLQDFIAQAIRQQSAFDRC